MLTKPKIGRYSSKIDSINKSFFFSFPILFLLNCNKFKLRLNFLCGCCWKSIADELLTTIFFFWIWNKVESNCCLCIKLNKNQLSHCNIWDIRPAKEYEYTHNIFAISLNIVAIYRREKEKEPIFNRIFSFVSCLFFHSSFCLFRMFVRN